MVRMKLAVDLSALITSALSSTVCTLQLHHVWKHQFANF